MGTAFRLKKPSLAVKLAGAFSLLSLLAVGLVGYAVYSQSSAVLREMVLARLDAVADLKKVELDNWVAARLNEAQGLAELGALGANLDKWSKSRDKPYSTIWCASFSPDKRLLATGGADHCVRVWDLDKGDKGTEKYKLPHENIVSLVRFLSNGRVMTKDYENILRIWDLERRRPVFSSRLARAVSLSGPGPDRLLAVSAWNKRTTLWKVADLLAPSGPNPGLVLGSADSWTALSPEGRLIGLADGKGKTEIRRIDPAGPAVLAPEAQGPWTIRGGESGLAFSPDNRWLASAAKDGTIRIHSLEPEKPPALAATLAGPPGDEQELAFSPDGRWFCLRADSSARMILAAETGGAWRAVLNLDSVYSFGFSPGPEPLLITALDDRDAAAWRLAQIDAQGVPARHDFQTETVGGGAVAFSNDGSLVSLASWAGRVQAFRVKEVLRSRSPANLALTGMRHPSLPTEVLGELLRTQVESRPEWGAALLLDAKGRIAAERSLTNPDRTLLIASAEGETARLAEGPAEDGARPPLLLSAPVNGPGGERLGGLAILLNYSGLDRIVKQNTGVGEQGELFLAGRNRLLSRVREGELPPGPLKPAAREPGRIYDDFSGRPVFGASRSAPEQGWTLTAEIPASQALAPARRLAWTAFGAACLLALSLFAAARLLSRKIALPIMAAADMAQRIVSGHVDQGGEKLEGDEAKVLSGAMDRMLPALEERARILQALDIAKEVQANLLPKSPPPIPGLDIAAVCDYCDQTGGDYFDFLRTSWPQGQGIAIVIGDVTGHGVPAALLMASLRAFLRQRAAASGPSEPASRVIRDVNNQLARDVYLTGRFATLFYLDMLPDQGLIRWVRAGHDPALVFDRESGFSQLEGAGTPLGVIEDMEYQEMTGQVRPGQVIVIGTDGIWETRNNDKEMFGKDRLKEVIRANASLPAREILQAALEAVRRFGAGVPKESAHEDDLTMVVIKIEPAADPARGES